MPFWLLQKGEKAPHGANGLWWKGLPRLRAALLGVLILSTIAKTVIRGHSMLVVILAPQKLFRSKHSAAELLVAVGTERTSFIVPNSVAII